MARLIQNWCAPLSWIVDIRKDPQRFLMLLGQLAARVTAEQVALVINCQIPGNCRVELLGEGSAVLRSPFLVVLLAIVGVGRFQARPAP